MTTTAQQLRTKPCETEAQRRRRALLQRDYDTMVGRATGRLAPRQGETYVHERPAFRALVRARGWA